MERVNRQNDKVKKWGQRSHRVVTYYELGQGTLSKISAVKIQRGIL